MRMVKVGLVFVALVALSGSLHAVVYSTDFSSDPGWITDNSSNYHWDPATLAYYVRHYNRGPIPLYKPNRYAYTLLDNGLGSFALQWDVKVTNCTWSAGIDLGIYDSNLMCSGSGLVGQSVSILLGIGDGGNLFGFYAVGSGWGTSTMPTSGCQWSLNQWYTAQIVFNTATRQIHYEIRNRDTGALLGENDISYPVGAFTTELRYLGTTRNGLADTGTFIGGDPNGVAEGRIDNVALTSSGGPTGPTGRLAFTVSDRTLSVKSVPGGTPQGVPLSGLSNAFSPKWSRNGAWITFSSGPTGNSQIYVVRPDGSGLRRVTDGSGDLVCPSFSPDGSQIAFQQVYGPLYTIRFDGTEKVDRGIYGGHPSWSPDGKKISCNNWGQTYNSDLFVLDLTTGTSTQITHHGSGDSFAIAWSAWSPDSSKLAVEYRASSSAKWDIALMNADGSGLVDLTPDWSSSDEGGPSWSSDGQFIVFNTTLSGNKDIWAMRPDGSSRTNLTSSPSIDEYGAIGPYETITADCGNGVTMEFVQIPAGSFSMGTASTDAPELAYSRPIHQVNIGQGFYMGKCEVTQEQYQAVMGTNPSHFVGNKNPVENVSWANVTLFCQKLSQKTGKTIRLPSEAEWEYACKADKGNDDTSYYFGNDVSLLPAYAWDSGNSGGTTHPVGQKLPNSFGLYDISGNVWEWCQDFWHDTYTGAPSDGSAWLTGGNQTYRVVRGGSWYWWDINCRSAYRGMSSFDGTHNDNWGFRVVLEKSSTVPQRVQIDVKPGSSDNPINLGSNGVVPVAILSSDSFDATAVDPATVKLAGASVASRAKGGKLQVSKEDVNGDGKLDLVLQFETQSLQIAAGATTVTLTGQTYSGEYITGTDRIKLVPAKSPGKQSAAETVAPDAANVVSSNTSSGVSSGASNCAIPAVFGITMLFMSAISLTRVKH